LKLVVYYYANTQMMQHKYKIMTRQS